MRLFKGESLYCEGKHKPFFRGKFHLFSLIFFPPAYYLLYQHATSTRAFWIGIISLTTNLICFTVSGLYHVFEWSEPSEIFLQKLDHSAISLWCVGMMLPIAFLLFPPYTGLAFFIILSSTFLYNMDALWNQCCPSIIKSSAIPLTLLLFIHASYLYMNSIEWISMWLVYAFQAAGSISYSVVPTTPCDIFGYHELFHVFSLFAAFFVYVINYSIVSRQGQTESCLT
uniref:Hemolysin III family channel protein n=1 Tax=viral metagenome TaxID=1070528 RepID=A0A6C0B708_9ZZZZ